MDTKTRRPSSDLMDAVEAVKKDPSQQNIDRVHQEMLMDFVNNAEGLKGMILVAIRQTGPDDQNVEVYAGTNSQNLLSAAAALANVAGQAAARDGADDKAELCISISKVLLELGGAKEDEDARDEFEGDFLQTVDTKGRLN